MSFEIRIAAWEVDGSTNHSAERAVIRTLRTTEDQVSTHAPTNTSGGTASLREEDPVVRETERRRRPDGNIAHSLPVARRALWRQAGEGLKEISLDRLPRGGEPTLGETGVTVSQILGLIADGYDIEKIVREYEGVVTRQEVREAILFASRLSS